MLATHSPVVRLLDLNPACSLRSLQSISLRIRSITILTNILLTTSRRFTPCQFLHSFRFPFFSILTLTPLFHLTGTFSNLQIISISSFTLSVVNSRSAFRRSALTRSSPGAFPFLRLFIALLVFKASLTGPVSISASSCCSLSS